jgi:endonuclease YncB( thermonuclease family)
LTDTTAPAVFFARSRVVVAAFLLALLALLAGCHQVDSPSAPRSPDRSNRTGAGSALVLKAHSIRVQDGDSFVARLEDGNTRTIRLSGIDAPERSQALADRSRQNLQRLLEHRELRVDVAKQDAYGRSVAQVFTSGEGAVVDVGLAQLESGLAWFYARYRNDLPPESRGRYAQAEQAARAAARGIWQADKPQAPWDFRRRQQPEQRSTGR